MPPKSRDDLLSELADELTRGQVYECSLRDARWCLDGLQDGPKIYIDPRPAILETLAHELLHRRYPRWGERKVTHEARRLIVGMDDRTKAIWWGRYRRIKKRSGPVDTSDT